MGVGVWIVYMNVGVVGTNLRVKTDNPKKYERRMQKKIKKYHIPARVLITEGDFPKE